jgi:hypothetical protein
MITDIPTIEQYLRVTMVNGGVTSMDDAQSKIDQINAWALGRLMAHAWRTCRADAFSTDDNTPNNDGCCGSSLRISASSLACLIVWRAHKLPPRYDDNSARDMLIALDETDASPGTGIIQGYSDNDILEIAGGVIEGLAGELTDEHRVLIGSLARKPGLPGTKPLLAALGAIAGMDVSPDAAISALQRMEIDSIARTAHTHPRAAISAARAVSTWHHPMDDDAIAPPGEYLLAQFPEFVQAARPAIACAFDQISAIQRGDIPYAADKALPYDDAHALARFVNVALDRNEPWLEPMLEPLLMGVAVAPVPTARTVPSQAATIGIARAISERLTFSSVAVLKRVIAAIRHAGVLKKLQGFFRLAERRLAAQPDLLIGIPSGFVVPKSLLGALRKSFENLYLNRRTFERQAFETMILNIKGIEEIAQALVWRVTAADGTSTLVQPVRTRSAHAFLDASGVAVTLAPDTDFSLWHPLNASDDEVANWQARILANGTCQPLNQVFREIYRLPADAQQKPCLDIFAGHAVDVHKLMGLALTTGWMLTRYDGFQRSVGELRFIFDCGNKLYPGARGETMTGNLTVTRRGEPLVWSEIDTEIVSEVLRSVDLLTSVAAFAIDAETPVSQFWPGACSAQSRRQVLCRLFGETRRHGHPWVEGRYVRVGDVSIHIVTAQARRGGTPLEVENVKGVVSLPYADSVLEKIVAQVSAAV